MTDDEIAHRLANAAAVIDRPVPFALIAFSALATHPPQRAPRAHVWRVFRDLCRLGVIGWEPGHEPSRFYLG